MAQTFKSKTLLGRSGIFSHQTIAPNLVYNTGNQIISGVKTFAENTTFGDSAQGDFLVISGNQFTVYGSGNFTSGLFVNGNAVLTGIDLSSYATTSNLASTGSTLATNLANTGSNLDTKINTLSGSAVLLYGNQTINDLKDFTTRPTVNTIPVLLSGEVSTTLSGVLYSAQINIKNNNGSTIYKGQPVYVSSAAGTNILVKLASNTGEQTSSKTLGLVYQTSLAQNAQGTIVTEGLLQGFNTNAGEEGDPIWLGPTGSLIFGLANKPYAPNHLVYLGVVTRKHANQGEVFVKIQNGFELQELHNVNIDHKNVLNDSDILRYNSASGLWFNETLNTGVFKTQIDSLSGSSVLLYGDQSISGVKNFASRPTFSGIQLLVNGDQGVSTASLFLDTVNLTAIPISGLINSIVKIDRYPPDGLARVSLPFGNNQYSGQKTTIMYSAYGITGDLQIEVYNNNPANGLASTHILSDGESMEFYRYNVLDYNSWYSIPKDRNTLNSVSQNYATLINLASTGSTLNTRINNLSGYINSPSSNIVFTTGDQIISGNKTFKNNVIIEQTGFFNAIDLSDTDNILLSGIDIQIVSGSMTLTNPPTISGNPFITGNLSLYATTINLASSGSTLNNNINSLSGLFTGFTGNLDTTYATDASVTTVANNLATTGSTLDTKINNLSGYINSSASNIVFTTGNQTISGVKTFANNIQVSGTGIFNAVDFNNIDIISLSGVDISITSGNVALTNRPTVNGTGVLLSGEASAITLPTTIVYTTGDQIISGNKTFISGVTFSGQNINIIDASLNLSGVGDMTFEGTNINFINSPVFISGTNLRVVGDVIGNNLVYNTGNQTISGIKTFIGNHIISGNLTISGNANISGSYDIYSQIENAKKLAIAYAIAL